MSAIAGHSLCGVARTGRGRGRRRQPIVIAGCGQPAAASRRATSLKRRLLLSAAGPAAAEASPACSNAN
eukprot:4371327-Pyramimonas_sp.AAC.1